MAPKSKLEKVAWEWAEKTAPQDVTEEHKHRAYRLDLKPCALHLCRRNCIGNPFCLNGLGEKWAYQEEEEKKEKKDKKEKEKKDGDVEQKCDDKKMEECDKSTTSSVSDGDSDSDDDFSCSNLDNKLRKPDEMIGLKNLGATCYINTLLQVWFHNPVFRRAVLLWRPEADEDNDDDDDDDDDDDNDDGIHMDVDDGGVEEMMKRRKSQEHGTRKKKRRLEQGDAEKTDADIGREACSKLRTIFAELKFSKRRYVNPSDFISCLRLDESMQQDAQEFSKLFLNLLDSVQPPLTINGGRSLVQGLFGGEYDYVTRCNRCEVQTHHSSNYSELLLNIKGNASLDHSIREFLEAEKLEGDNQYMCPVCGIKCDATRRIQLRTLPPVLNLQLARFIFDRKTLSKKKLNTYVQFPLQLDMSQYALTQTGGVAGLVYDLYAVLMHSGTSANSGHYMALIRDIPNSRAYVMNDTEVTTHVNEDLRMEDIETADKSAGKKPRLRDGHMMSCNAYMLVYRQRQHVEQQVPDVHIEEIEDTLRSIIQVDNDEHEDHVTDYATNKKSLSLIKKARKNDIKSVYSSVFNDKGDIGEWEWICSKWLSNWVSVSSVESGVKAVDNNTLLCEHERMDPNKIEHAKLLPSSAIMKLQSKYGIDIRLPCKDTLCMECVMRRCHKMSTLHTLNENFNHVRDLCKVNPPSDLTEAESEGWYWVGKDTLKNWKKMAEHKLFPSSPDDNESVSGSGGADVDNDSAEEETKNSAWTEDDFNYDIICEHGELSASTTFRKQITSQAWRIMKQYFPDVRDMTASYPVCPVCQLDDKQIQEEKEKVKNSAQQQRQDLSNLYSRRCRPQLGDHDTLYVITESFLNSWTAFIKDPKRKPQPTDLGNQQCICPHDGLKYNLKPGQLLVDNLQYLTADEWDTLKKYIEPDYEIISHRYVENGDVVYSSIPDTCLECYNAEILSELKNDYVYENGTVRVFKLADYAAYLQQLGNSSESTAAEDSSAASADHDEINSSDNASTGTKRKSPDTAVMTSSAGASSKQSCMDTSSQLVPRRSTRKQDCKQFNVSSDLTIQNFKIQLYNAYGVMKSDQHVLYNGVELNNDDWTFATYHIPRNAALMLYADDPQEELLPEPDVVEEGFRGSALIGQQ